MRIKYQLIGHCTRYAGDYDLDLPRMLTGFNEMLNEHWISFPCGFEFRTQSKVEFESVRDALTAVLTGEVDDAILDGIGKIESWADPALNIPYNHAAFFANSRFRPLSPIPEGADEVNPWAQEGHHSNSPELSNLPQSRTN